MATEIKQYGLKTINTMLKPSIDTIEQIFTETQVDFESNKALIEQLIEYYKGNQNEGVPSTGQNVDEKKVVNYTKLLCDTAVSIILTKPIKYISRIDDPNYQADVQMISDYITDEGDHETNLNTETDIIVDGVGYQYCLQQDTEKDPTPNSPFTIGRFAPNDTYVVRSCDIGEKVVCSFYIAEFNNGKIITAFDNDNKYILYPKNWVDNNKEVLKDTKLKAGKDYYINVTSHGLPFNPISEFKNDMYGLSTVADLMGEQDSLNNAISNYDNDVIMKIKQLLVVIGCEVDEEALKQLRTNGVLNLPQNLAGTGNIDAKFVSSQLNENIITYIKDTIERMSMLAGCPNQNATGNAETGVAVEVQNGHTVANFLSNKREQAFYKPKREQLSNIIEILRRNNKLKSDITAKDIEIKFDKNRLASVTENVNNLIQLLNNYVEPLDALNVCPIFDDNKGVADRINENKEKEIKELEKKANEQQNSETNNTKIQENTVSKLQ